VTDVLVGVVLSNLIVSGMLAIAAYLVHRRGRYPVLSHLLWVLVLVKLVTPPLMTLPVVSIPAIGVSAGQATLAGASDAGGGTSLVAIVAGSAVAVLLLAWAAGSGIVLIASLRRIRRFDQLLRTTSTPAPAAIQQLADGLIDQLGLRAAPTIYLSTTRLSPLTWWTGTRVRIVIPTELPQEVDGEGLRWVLAHELAHVKRRDYMVRWLEWLACVAFWWNPVVWWTRRYLRDDEEASCDALVVDRLGAQPHSYASTLLNVVEFLSGDANQPPAVATGIDGGGSLERRLRLIITTGHIRTAPRWLVAGVMSSALILMPLGLGSTPHGDVVDDAATGGAAAASETFSVISGRLSDSAATALRSGSISSGSISPGSISPGSVSSADIAPSKVKRARKRAKRTVQRALVASLSLAPDATRASKRAARAAISKAKTRLDNAVAKGVISRNAAQVLLRSLRQLIKPSASATSIDLGVAVKAGVISPGNATKLIDALG
jgi:beta-lactamase regulating signal transducer with metallopeptidase domain